MKNYISILILLSIVTVSFGQNNVVKLHLESIAYGAANVGYERVLNEKLTLGVNVGVFIPRKIPSSFYTPDNSEPDYIKADEIRNQISGTMITPEFRFYPGSRGAPQGFYIGSFLKFSNYKMNLSETYNYNLSDEEYNNLDPNAEYYSSVNHADKSIDITTDMEFKLRQIGIGAQLGVQWVIADRVTIDWGFAGLGANFFKSSGEFRVIDVPVDYSRYLDDAVDNLNEDLEDIPFIRNAVAKATDEGNSLKVSLPFTSPSFRTYLSLGFKF